MNTWYSRFVFVDEDVECWIRGIIDDDDGYSQLTQSNEFDVEI